MYCYLWRVGAYGWRGELGAEDVGDVCSYFEGRDGRVVGGTRELVGAAHYCDASILSLGVAGCLADEG